MQKNPQRVSFRKGMRGYRTRQVDAYIETLCKEFSAAEEDYQSRIVSLEKEIARLSQEVRDYTTLQNENDELRRALAAKSARRVLTVRYKSNREDPAKKKTPLTPKEKEERTKRAFHASAEVLRLLGNTTRQVTRIVQALPSPTPAPKEAPAPKTVKDAKILLRTLNQQEKLQKKTRKTMQKIKREQKKLDRVNR
jgi:DivIVA domain-containing protein